MLLATLCTKRCGHRFAQTHRTRRGRGAFGCRQTGTRPGLVAPPSRSRKIFCFLPPAPSVQDCDPFGIAEPQDLGRECGFETCRRKVRMRSCLAPGSREFHSHSPVPAGIMSKGKVLDLSRTDLESSSSEPGFSIISTRVMENLNATTRGDSRNKASRRSG